MSIQFNHLIIFAHDKRESAYFFTELLGLPKPEPSGNFLAVDFYNDVTLNYAEPGTDFPGQHYAFLVSADEFDEIWGRVKKRGIEYWADPHQKKPGELYYHDKDKGFYFFDPSGHGMEVFTRSS